MMTDQLASETGQHTTEPWAVDGEHFNYYGLPRVLGPEGEIVAGVMQTAANARRIVACVNACTGVPTEKLETLDPKAAFLGKLVEADAERDTLREEKAELLAALMVQANAWDVLVQTGHRKHSHIAQVFVTSAERMADKGRAAITKAGALDTNPHT